ncbi:MAG: hypothetical protein P4M02_06740, partial [Clostridia bacterium]|nr:hypothetical protein [Clostridia bacterium]
MPNHHIKPILKTAGIVLALCAYVAGAWFFSRSTPYYNITNMSGADRISYEKARVLSIDYQDVGPDKTYRQMQTGTQTATIRILTGEYKGQAEKIKNGLNYDSNYLLSPGEDIIVSVNTAASGKTINIFLYSPDRGP